MLPAVARREQTFVSVNPVILGRVTREKEADRKAGRKKEAERMGRSRDMLGFLDTLREAGVFFEEDLAGIRTLKGRRPRFAKGFPSGLDPAVVEACRSAGIDALYAHQFEAIEEILAGRDVVLVAPTATGKSLCFNLPVISHLANKRRRHALYVYPMKALENDQRLALIELTRGLPPSKAVSSWVFDGDTEQDVRKLLKQAPPHILITTPDSIHYAMLAWNEHWTEFLRALDYIVLDEAHEYRGYFGINVAYTIRRLLALCASLGARPRVIVSSATIANPDEHGRALTGRSVTVAEAKDLGAPTKHWVFLNPRYQDFRYEDMLIHKLALLSSTAVEEGVSALIFCPSRRFAELAHKRAGSLLSGRGQDPEAIAPYRAGYTPEERREIETGLKDGSKLVVFSTNALEIGIDMGRLDLVVMVGFPDTVISAWQRAGRAGRNFEKEAMVMVIASRSAIDQFYVQHIDLFLKKPLDRLALNLDNPELLERHALCAIFELGGKRDYLTPQILGPALAGKCRQLDPDLKIMRHVRPEHRLNMRSIFGSPFVIRGPDEREIGTISGDKLFSEVYIGAIYDHYGRSWRVKSHSADAVYVEPNNLFHYTRPSRFWTIQPRAIDWGKRWSSERLRVSLMFGSVQVTDTLTGYREYDEKTGELIEEHPYETFSVKTFRTEACWLNLERRDGQPADERYLQIHSLEHAIRAVVPLAVVCDPFDMSGLSQAKGPLGEPALYLYDAVEGGIGLAEAVANDLERILPSVRALLSGCSCETSCPRCIQIARCAQDNQDLSRHAGLDLLKALVRLFSKQPQRFDASTMQWI